MFKLYWFNPFDGSGYPAKDYPGDYTHAEAWRIVQTKPRHKDRALWKLELHREPVEVHMKYTVKNPAV